LEFKIDIFVSFLIHFYQKVEMGLGVPGENPVKTAGSNFSGKSKSAFPSFASFYL